jgi:hypothetical protein
MEPDSIGGDFPPAGCGQMFISWERLWQGWMSRDKIIIQKIAAIILIFLGLLAMLVAWELLLVSNIHNTTVLVLEMGGVLVCMAGYFLHRRIKAQEEDAKIQKRAS